MKKIMSSVWNIPFCTGCAMVFITLTTIQACIPDADGKVDFSGSLLTDRIVNTTFEDCIPYVENITELDLSNNSISFVSRDSFSMFVGVKTLLLSHNRLQDIPKETFRVMRSLEVLDLSYNLLWQLEAGLLDIVSLTHVYFNNNNISRVEPGIVGQYNKGLVYFNMNNNSLTELDPWPYTTYQTNTRQINRNFYVQHNNIKELSNHMGWKYDLVYPFEVNIYAQFNKISTLSADKMRMYKENVTDEAMFPMFLTLYLNVTNNEYFCDCKLYNFVRSVRGSVLRYSRADEFRYRCASPALSQGWDFLRDLPVAQLVCNLTQDCPAGCFCQERPHNDTLFIDCSGKTLTQMPEIIPDTKQGKIEMFLDNNMITELKRTSYLSKIYNISLRNNRIQNLDANLLADLSAKHVDLRNNLIKSIPVEVKKFESIKLTGNPLECDCDSFWIKEWFEIDVDNSDPELKCTAKTGDYLIMEMTYSDLGCTNEGLIIIGVCLAVVFAFVVTVIIFARRCPYETKVLVNNLFKLHPADKYAVDKNNNKDVDIYLVFDGNDTDVVGYVKYFVQKLNRKKPIYSVLNPEKFMEPGSAQNNIFKYIGKAKRVIVLLSKGIFHNDIKLDEIEDAEHRQVEAVTQNNNSDLPNRQDLAEEIEGDRKNAPKIIYVIYNKDKTLTAAINKEPWRSRLANKTVLDPDDKWFMSKLRYELPPKGNGEGDGTYWPSEWRDVRRPGGTTRNNYNAENACRESHGNFHRTLLNITQGMRLNKINASSITGPNSNWLGVHKVARASSRQPEENPRLDARLHVIESQETLNTTFNLHM